MFQNANSSTISSELRDVFEQAFFLFQILDVVESKTFVLAVAASLPLICAGLHVVLTIFCM